MRRLRFLALLILAPALLIGIFGRPAAAQDPNNFTISKFDAEYYLDKDASNTSFVNVVEHITAQFPNLDQNHGILRAIPKSYRGHTVSLQIQNVKNKNGQPWHYTTYSQNDNLVLKIGDADRFVHGTQDYIIRYQLRNVALLLADRDEFYWDVNGDQWLQSFNEVSAKIYVLPKLVSALQDRKICFTGYSGSQSQSDCEINRTDGPTEVVFSVDTKTPLSANQTLSFAIAFNPETFQPGPEIAHEQKVNKIHLISAIVSIAVPPIVAFTFMFRRWRQFGNDPKGRGVIIPEYEPPKDFTVLTSAYLLNEKLPQKAFSAAIIELAVKKYITVIEEVKKKRFARDTKEYSLRLEKSPEDLPPELKRVVEAIFDDTHPGSLVLLASFKKSATLAGQLYKDLKKLEDSLASILFSKKYFVKNPKDVRQGYMIWAGILAIIGLAVVFIHPIAIAAIGWFLAAAVVFSFSFIMPARSERGVLANDALLGLKDYIKLAEADRQKFGQSPEGAEKIADGSFDPTSPKMKVKLFETLLPYAVLFGLEKGWAKQFEDIYKSPPDWYQGNWTTFNAYYLASSISGFSSVANVTFGPPSSSGSGGFGGGGAGGGGGGGGGGGW